MVLQFENFTYESIDMIFFCARSWSFPYHDVLSATDVPSKPGMCVCWLIYLYENLSKKSLIIVWCETGERASTRECLEMDYLSTVKDKVQLSKHYIISKDIDQLIPTIKL
jgi:hypothetical protein